MAVKMELVRLLIRETDDLHILELKEVDGERSFPIVIGINEAMTIRRRLTGQAPPRPLTHELLANAIAALGAVVEKMVITRIDQGVFYTNLVLKQGDQEIVLDARPSDAIALGASADIPIFVEQAVLEAIINENPAPE